MYWCCSWPKSPLPLFQPYIIEPLISPILRSAYRISDTLLHTASLAKIRQQPNATKIFSWFYQHLTGNGIIPNFWDMTKEQPAPVTKTSTPLLSRPLGTHQQPTHISPSSFIPTPPPPSFLPPPPPPQKPKPKPQQTMSQSPVTTLHLNTKCPPISLQPLKVRKPSNTHLQCLPKKAHHSQSRNHNLPKQDKRTSCKTKRSGRQRSSKRSSSLPIHSQRYRRQNTLSVIDAKTLPIHSQRYRRQNLPASKPTFLSSRPSSPFLPNNAPRTFHYMHLKRKNKKC